MFGFSVRTWQNGFGSPRSVDSPGALVSPARPDSPALNSSPKVDVGEIDTRAPFESVKAAVSLFGEVISPRARPVTKKTRAEEQRLLEKETQHHMILRELDYYKDKLRSIEAAKAQASKDLHRANRTLQELTNKLEALSESKQAAIQTTDVAKRRSKQLEEQKSIKAQLGHDAWKLDVDTERECYKASSGQLIASKQELTNLRQDVDAALDAKLAAFQEHEDARQSTQANLERKAHLTREVESLRETIEQVKVASLLAEEEHLKLTAEKEIYVLVHKSAKEIAEREINRLRDECGRPGESNLKGKLEEANEAIKVLREQLNDVRTSDLCSLQVVVTELDSNKRELEKIVEERNSIRSYLDSIRSELEDVRIRHRECETKALEAESKLEQMRDRLEIKKTELEEARSNNVFDQMQSDLEKLLAEAERDRSEAEKLHKEIELLRQEAEAANFAAREADEKLEVALKEAEAAKAAEKLADEKIHDSPRADAVESSKGPGSLRRIRLTAEEFESMNKKIEECKKQADEKVTSLMAQLRATNAGENEVSQKVERMLREIEVIKSEIEDAVKRAEMAEGAKKIVEGELQKWRREEDCEVGEPSYVVDEPLKRTFQLVDCLEWRVQNDIDAMLAKPIVPLELYRGNT
ncbi:WEB family protein at1g12150 [Phtheirospermum japonicum]|uniref:WEB family protein at1g12150 n=1 Tax=Phtheirospermum japonicum TaxID=374723 RepID=A0A830CXS7_9LAMI|nr:WEB family protein at1g12150 [Phtheirospermum japonicum]